MDMNHVFVVVPVMSLLFCFDVHNEAYTPALLVHIISIEYEYE